MQVPVPPIDTVYEDGEPVTPVTIEEALDEDYSEAKARAAAEAQPAEPAGTVETVISSPAVPQDGEEMRLQDLMHTAGRRRASLVAAAAPVLAEWTSPGIAYLDTKTGDGRALSGEIDWRTPPLPLMAQLEDAHGSMPVMQSRMAGGINQLAIEGLAVPASGVLDDTETGRLALEALQTGRYGVSIDLAVSEAEYVLSNLDDDVSPIILASISEEHGLAESDDLVLPMSVDDELFVVTRGTIMGATIVPFAAFADARIVLTASGEDGYPEMIRLAPAPHLLVTARPAGVSSDVLAAVQALEGAVEVDKLPSLAAAVDAGLLTQDEAREILGRGPADTRPVSPSSDTAALLAQLKESASERENALTTLREAVAKIEVRPAGKITFIRDEQGRVIGAEREQ